ncbi:hypothetical protein BpHYR1_035205 [Brachionus plicatilis]|uniref:Uncharacterized protein n=1 Tax=Brachionus plicatilis TaxID=10195 RepID=A0A3M7T975_BRAPC|nr:hypothetical protein BpHYR1_035205 [Brachionus plicatilis]
MYCRITAVGLWDRPPEDIVHSKNDSPFYENRVLEFHIKHIEFLKKSSTQQCSLISNSSSTFPFPTGIVEEQSKKERVEEQNAYKLVLICTVNENQMCMLALNKLS